MLDLTAIAELKERIAHAVEDEAAAILTVAQERIPRDTSTAHDSGKVVTEGDTTWISFGSDADRNPKTGQPSNSYIEALEFDLERRHPNGQALFLSSAGDDATAGMAERIAVKARI